MAMNRRLTNEEELAWERGFAERMRNLRELAEGRARREWLVAHGLDPNTPPSAPPDAPGDAPTRGDVRRIVSRSLSPDERRRFGFPDPT
jgi:hypothetical protein